MRTIRNLGSERITKTKSYSKHRLFIPISSMPWFVGIFSSNGQSQIEYHGELSNVQAIQNAAKAFVYGFEFGLEAFVTDNLSLSSNLTLTEGVEEEPDGTESPGSTCSTDFW